MDNGSSICASCLLCACIIDAAHAAMVSDQTDVFGGGISEHVLLGCARANRVGKTYQEPLQRGQNGEQIVAPVCTAG